MFYLVYEAFIKKYAIKKYDRSKRKYVTVIKNIHESYVKQLLIRLNEQDDSTYKAKKYWSFF